MRSLPGAALFAFIFSGFCGAPAAAQSILFSNGDPTDHEQYMLELVNAARSDPAGATLRLGIDLNTGLAPGTIGAGAKPPFAFHPVLTAAARKHSDWMLAAGVFSHTGVDGTTPTQRAALLGFPNGVAENIAYQWTNSASDYAFLTPLTRRIHEALVVSPGHRPNLMDDSHTVVGIGLRQGSFRGLNTLMGTQKFSSPGEGSQSGPFILGVCYHDRNHNGSYDPGEGADNVRVDTSLADYHAVTTASGGYTIPVVPIATNVETVNLPVPLKDATWESVRSYDAQYRADRLAAAPLMTVEVVWSGVPGYGFASKEITIARPVRVNYRLLGTDGYRFDRSMVTAQNIKSDLLLPVAKSSQRITFRTASARPFRRGKSFSLGATSTSLLPVTFMSSNPRILSISGRTATMRARGTVRITAQQPGNANYNAAPAVVRTVTLR